MLVFFTNLSLKKFQVRYLAFFLLSSVIDGFGWFLLGRLKARDQASDLWQHTELASELESDLQGTVDWGRKWLVDFNAGKALLVLFHWSNNTGAIDVKMDGSALEENHLLRCWGWLSCFNWI